VEEKTYPEMDLPVHGEADGANFISVSRGLNSQINFSAITIL